MSNDGLIERGTAATLRLQIWQLVHDLENANGISRAHIGAAMVGIGGALLHANSKDPSAVDLAIQAVKDAIEQDGKTRQ